MTQELTQNILNRLTKLEDAVFSDTKSFSRPLVTAKTRTLPELIKGKTFKNGQEKVAIIVGYREHESGTGSSENDIKAGWGQAKFDGRYAHTLLSRAVADGLVSNYGKKGEYVLTQTGEAFYQAMNQ